uniref:Uncharacterized protein n=1 Tax=viral metagenome TaxID=1070528 RepID=A0A6C0J1A7_9ZZZZ
MNKTEKNINHKKRRTMKVYKNNSKNNRNSYIVQQFLELLNMVKLYHWKTHSYAQHKATDELYERLNKNIDTFVETLLGKENNRIKMVEKQLRILDNSNTRKFKNNIYEFRDFLTSLDSMFNKKDSGILSIRDDLLVDINQFLYLMTFDK